MPDSNISPQKIYLGAGCFWSKEYFLSKLTGVLKTQVGFMGGQLKQPSYQQVCTKNSGHAEVVEVIYDSSLLPTDKLLHYFTTIHDPTSDRRSNGGQYRSAIFYTCNTQKESAQRWLSSLEKKGYSISTEINKAKQFWPADERHQQFCENRQLKPRTAKGLVKALKPPILNENKR